ncbi:MAG TPA: DEAD/DEAH box helicase, partial [Polyangia bacterium]
MPGEPHAAPFHPVVRDWFARALGAPTPAQRAGWPLIRAGRSTLLLAPTGSGKTLAAFLAAIERLMFTPPPARPATRVLYVSPLKALAVDIERNLRVPLAGIAAAAAAAGVPHHVPAVALRTGDTPAGERARMRRRPPDILITTPESLYLLLTSSAQAMLATVATVIVDEVHALVPTKRGAHLALSLERLEEVRPPGAPPLQRIGLSATQRPPEEAARLLGGFAARPGRAAPRPREVAVVDARQARKLDVTVEVPAHELFLRGAAARGLAPAAAAAPGPSIWPALHPRLLELVRAHRSTIIFVNNRRLTERLAAALNDLAGDTVAQAHHGSLAREKRLEVEERLKAGALPAIVATSSLELGIDMGAVDLCIQIEAPPSVASGLQRIGRAGHRLDATSRGIIFPKFRGDLLASAAAARLMREHQVEETAYPRSPLDVLAQQLVAICAMGERHVDELYALCRRAAPFAELARGSFDGVLDMLAGRYPSDAFAGLKARLVWDRDTGTVRARAGAGRIAVTSGGTIPDRGLYGVFLASAEGRTVRVGELDEEMVFESRVGEVFLLGASAWRIEEITRDRVLVSPAPGQPGKMPFWHGDRPGRPLELGRAIGKLARDLVRLDDAAAQARLVADHALAPDAAASLVAYLREQRQATGEVPSDHVIVVERYQDEMGDWRVCVLMPFGARVHAPWCAAVEARLRRDAGLEVETLHGDDGIVFRFPEADAPPPVEQLVPSYADAEALILGHLPETALFAAHFREIAARALLLPRRLPGRRAPLWQQRKRAADLLQIAARYGSFPMVLETYRECLRDVFDMPALREVLDGVASRAIRVLTVTTRVPSPFAASLLFSYVGSFIYDADAPLAERRARALAVDLRQLRELLGEAELRDLLDADAIAAEERRLQALDPPPFCRDADDLHDLLVRLGDLTTAEIKTRCPEAGPALTALLDARRALPVRVGGEARLIAVEDAARYHDGAGVELPAGVPAAFREAVADPLGDLVSRYARTHGPFAAAEAAARLGVEVAPVLLALGRLQAQERIVEGELRPGRRGQEFCDAEVLRRVKQRSLARLRRAAEPVPVESYARFAREWQGLARPLAGPEALAAAVEQLQGAALPASVLETEVLPARVAEYRAGDLDALCAAGEVLWA